MDRRFLTANGAVTGGGWLARALGLVGGVAVMAGLALVSVVAAGVLLVTGGVVWGVIWWKTRHLRRAMREAASGGQQYASTDWRAQAHRGAPEDSEHVVLEGDFIREVEEPENTHGR